MQDVNEDTPATAERKRTAFALARARVEKAGALPADAAEAWLYERIREGKIEAWYTAKLETGGGAPRPVARSEWMTGQAQPVRRRTYYVRPTKVAPDKLPRLPRDGFIKRCEVVATDLDRQVATFFAVAHEPIAKPRRGAPPKVDWAEICRLVHDWLAYDGGECERGTQARVEAFMTEELARRGETAAPSTFRRHAKMALDEFKHRKGSQSS